MQVVLPRLVVRYDDYFDNDAQIVGEIKFRINKKID